MLGLSYVSLGSLWQLQTADSLIRLLSDLIRESLSSKVSLSTFVFVVSFN